MGRFIIDKPSEIGARQINVIKKAPISRVKTQVRRLVAGEASPSELMDPGKYISEDSALATLLGTKDRRERPKYFTPYGAAASDWFVLRRKWSEEIVGDETPIFEDEELILGSENTTDWQTSTTVVPHVDEFVDLSAIITISQKKNILLTKVQGRDRCRKEYISGGDYMVSIQGTITGRQPEQYPEEEVQMLRTMLELKEVISVDSPILNRFGINGLLVLDFKIPQRKASSNSQQYQINAVFEKPIEFIEAEATEKSNTIQDKLKKLNEWVALDIGIDKAASKIKI